MRITLRKQKPRSVLKRMSATQIMVKSSVVGLTAFLVTLLSASIFAPVQETNAGEIQLVAQSSGITVSTSGATSLNVQTGASGATIQTAVDAVRVTSGGGGISFT